MIMKKGRSIGLPTPGTIPVTAPVTAGTPAPARENPRFRSFAERYLMERMKFFPTDPEKRQEAEWICMLDAKAAYQRIREMSKGVEPDAGFT